MLPIKFTRTSRKHRIGRAHAQHVISTQPYTRYPATDDLDPRIEWIGPDDRGIELEIIAVEFAGRLAGHPRHADRAEERKMSEPQFDPGDVDLEKDDVRDSRDRRIDEDYVRRAVADVHRRRGRPALSEGEASEQFSLRVPVQTRRRLDELAAAEGRTASDVAREAIDAYLDSH